MLKVKLLRIQIWKKDQGSDEEMEQQNRLVHNSLLHRECCILVLYLRIDRFVLQSCKAGRTQHRNCSIDLGTKPIHGRSDGKSSLGRRTQKLPDTRHVIHRCMHDFSQPLRTLPGR